MKYEITCKCGHTETHDIFGTNTHGERDKKVAYLEGRICKECYAKAQREEATRNADIVTMLYSEYKNKYAECKTVSDSYDKKAKTIDVIIPREAIEENVVTAEEAEKVVTEIVIASGGKCDQKRAAQHIRNLQGYKSELENSKINIDTMNDAQRKGYEAMSKMVAYLDSVTIKNR